MISSFALLLLLSTCVGTHSKPIMPNTNKKLERHNLMDMLSGRKKIVGGVEAEVGRYPFMVSLLSGTSSSPFCGGSLVAPNWVLSAAHCAGIVSRVLIGHHELDNVPDSAEFINAEYEILHPDYIPDTFEHDLMMIKLETNSSFPTIDLSSTTPEAGTDVTVIGWGSTGEVCLSNELREVTVQMVDRAECADAYAAYGGVTEDMLCAAATGKDSCQGDSGGPIFVKGDDAADDVQIGVVSWGYGCACEGYPGVYANVAEQLDFVNDTIANDAKPETYPEACEFPDDGFDYGECEVSYPCFIGDGFCEIIGGTYYNTAECNYDGGDCTDPSGIVMGVLSTIFILPYYLLLLI